MFICASVHTVKQTVDKQMKAANSTRSSQNAWPGVNLNYWDHTILDDHSDFLLNLKILNKLSRLHSWESFLLWSSCTVMIVHWKMKILLICTHSLPHPWKIPVFIQSIVNNMPNFSHSSAQILNFITKKKQRILWMNNKKRRRKQYSFSGGCICLGWQGENFDVPFLISSHNFTIWNCTYFQLHMVSCDFSVFIWRCNNLSEQLNTEIHT